MKLTPVMRVGVTGTISREKGAETQTISVQLFFAARIFIPADSDEHCEIVLERALPASQTY